MPSNIHLSDEKIIEAMEYTWNPGDSGLRIPRQLADVAIEHALNQVES